MRITLRSPICAPISRRTLAAGLVGMMVGVTLGFAMIVWANRNAPLIIHEAKELDGVAARTGHIDLYFAIDRIRDCPSETSRWLWTWVDHDGGRIKQFYPLQNTTTTLSDIGRNQQFILTIPIPAGVWPGHWFYWSKTIEHCPFFPSLSLSQVRESNDIPIQILDEAP